MLTGLRERGPTPQCWGPSRRSIQGTDSAEQVGSREREDPTAGAFIWGQRGKYKQKV